MNDPSFFLEGVVKQKDQLQDFEGPLSLILLLLQKNRIEIRDIVISDILEQYLEYLDRMQSMDLEVASEFVQMASHLLYIKTKMLLTGDEEEVSELEILMSSLEQLKSRDILASVKQLVPELKKKSEFGSLYLTKLPEPLPKRGKEYEYRHEPVDLLRAMFNIYSRGGKAAEPDISEAVPKQIIYSIRDKSIEILERLKTGSATLNELYRGCATRSELVATFMSVLELCSMGSLFLTRLDGDYRAEFVGGDVDEIIEKIVE